MSDYPERISISPTSRQKREDDFFLVDRKAFPGKGTEYVRADRIEELEAENAVLKTSGIIEVAVRNPSVMEYMQHWEGRAEAAEAKLAKAVEAIQCWDTMLDNPQYDLGEMAEEFTTIVRTTLKELTGGKDAKD